MYRKLIEIGQRISLLKDQDEFNFELLLGLIDAYHLGGHFMEPDNESPKSKWFFYTVTLDGEPENGILMTSYDHFNIRFLMDSIYGDINDVVINWWTEISAQQAIEYVGPNEFKRAENEMLHGRALNEAETEKPLLRLVKNPPLE
jgi:hypothetical protein